VSKFARTYQLIYQEQEKSSVIAKIRQKIPNSTNQVAKFTKNATTG
jgi:hypothetical protein